MKINYEIKKDFPALAWIAIVNNSNVHVICGGGVECKNKYFVEGAWSGDFGLGKFSSSEWFCGTGAEIKNDSIVFSTPTHVTYSLFSAIDEQRGVVISNSNNLLMAYLDYKYDPNYIDYEIDFNTVLDGINNYKKDIHVLTNLEEKKSIQIHYFCDLIIDSNNNFKIVQKDRINDFNSYYDYENRLKKAMSKMVKNAQDSSRIHVYDITTAISKGYDASACAAIFKDLGCNTAFTFSAVGKYIDDSGVDVAKQLGYQNIIEREATEFKKRNDIVEAHIISSGDLGSSISSCVFDDLFKHKIVLSGERGDKIWNKNADNVNDEFIFSDFVSGLGYGEHRLWIDFIPCPMPLYGATAWESIHAISNSEEMQCWSVSNSYDRPIPRRIVEECGVKRDSFGMRKHGAGFTYKFDWMNRIRSRMSPTAFDSFKQYVEENKKFNIKETISYFYKMKSVYLSKVGLKTKRITPGEIGKIANPMSSSLLIPWAGNLMIKKYKKLIEE